MSLDTTGVDSASMIPAGAVIESTSWHVALLYGPGEPHRTEREALVAGIREAERQDADRLSIDLRWKMKWPQGSLDPNGRPTFSAGMEFTVRRTRYRNLTEAREHLARMDAIYGAPDDTGVRLRSGDTITLPADPVTVTIP